MEAEESVADVDQRCQRQDNSLEQAQKLEAQPHGDSSLWKERERTGGGGMARVNTVSDKW